MDAKNTLSIISGGDTTIEGAQAKGNTVLAHVGGNLGIRSQQDTDDFASKQQQASGKVVVGYGGSASGSYNQSNVDSHYASVTTVSGIAAGDGGYNIHVGGNTDLKGGVIASTADAAKNVLDTGSLTFSDIANKANYSASSIGVSGGTGGAAVGPKGLAPNVGIPQGDDSHSVTKAGIANGTIITRNGSTDLSGLDRTATLDQQGLKPIFDQQKVQERQEMGQVAGYVGMRTAGTVAGYMADHASTDGEKAAWSDGGRNKVFLHDLVGAGTAALSNGDAMGGAIGAGASEAASGAMQKYMNDQHITDPAERNTFMNLASAVIGGVSGGGAGAATALQGEQFNRQLHPDYVQHLQTEAAAYAAQQCGCDINKMSPDDRQAAIDNAAQALLVTAQRMQDNAFNAKFNGEAMDASAQAFIQKDNFGEYIGGTYYNLANASADERANPTINGYALYTQLNKDDNGGIGALMAATGYTLGQYAGFALADYNTGRPQAQAFDVGMQNWNSQDATSFLKFYGGIALAGGGAGALSTAAVLAEFAGAGTTTSNALGFLASPTGAGAIAGTINAGSQYAQTGTVNPVNVAVSATTAALGMKGGFWWNVSVNAEGGAVQTVVNNNLYGTNESVIQNAATSAISSAAGYGTGLAAGKVVGFLGRPGINSAPEWTPLGNAPYIQQWTGQSDATLFNTNPLPIIFGNAASSVTTEGTGAALNPSSSKTNENGK